MAEKPRLREHWGTRLGVILAVTGSAVGLGNFLRFPGLAAKYEGGAFMIPYFVAFFLLGLPLAWAEWAMGRYGGARGFNSAAGIYRSIWKSRAAPYFGALAVLVPVVIYMYYVLIEGWCLAYAWYTLTGTLSLSGGSAAYDSFFADVVGANDNGFIFGRGGDATIIFIAICFLLNFVLIYRGLVKGIEWLAKWAMPALILLALVVLVRVLTLDNIGQGLGFMWNPRTEKAGLLTSLSNGQMWLEAAGQIFFSLSVGFGIIVNYASYVRRDADIALSALTSASGNEFCEVALGGLITVPAAFVFLGAAGAVGSTFGLGFKTLPMVFDLMPLGRLVGTSFFFLLFLAALTSSVSMLQPAIALLEEGAGMGRRASVTVLGFVVLCGAGFVMYFSKGLTALDTFDFWVGTFCIYLVATFQIILFGWGMGLDKGHEEINRGAEMRVPRAVMHVVRYVSPAFLLIVFAAFLWQQISEQSDANRFLAIVKDQVVLLSVVFIAMVGGFFALIVAQANRRWQRDEQRGFEVERK